MRRHALVGLLAALSVLAAPRLSAPTAAPRALEESHCLKPLRLISLSSPSRYERVNVLSAVHVFRVSALFVATEEDHPFPEEAQKLYDACASAEKQLRIFAGFEHGVFMLRNPDARAAVDDFVARHSA